MKNNLNPIDEFMDDGYIHAEITAHESEGTGLRHSSFDYTVLMSLIGGNPSIGAAEITSAILAGKKARLIMLKTVEVPGEASLSTGALPAREYRRLLEAHDSFDKLQTVDIKTLVKVSRNTVEAISAALDEEGCNLMIIPWPNELASNRCNETDDGNGGLLWDVLSASPVDLVVIKPGKPGRYGRVLVCLQSGPDVGLALETALSIADRYGSELSIIHVRKRNGYGEEVTREDLILRSSLAQRGFGVHRYRIIPAYSNDMAALVRMHAADHDLIITGVSATGSNGYDGGRVPASILENEDATVVITKSAVADDRVSANLEVIPLRHSGNGKNGEAPVQTSDISDNVDRWFAENTFHASEFADIEELVEAKRKQGLTISLGLPTLNEEQTIGTIIETIKTNLFDRYPLIDEIAVIDSDSKDNTVKIAESLGVKVIREHEVLPAWGSLLGKGGALWKSLYALNGDIIAWIDTDIKNIHPRFVYGLVGPLIKYPALKYVKGFYRRPVAIGDQLIETGGGRVTELTARPLLNLFFSELSGFVQPLSGEYAGRREVLEQVGFHDGYGVEIGLLLNILEQFSLGSMCQVDLVERIHRNQSLENLSKMSFAIVQVIVDKLRQRHQVELLRELNKTMKLVKHEPEQFYLDSKTIEETMKPPIVTVPEYRHRFKGIQLEIGDMTLANRIDVEMLEK